MVMVDEIIKHADITSYQQMFFTHLDDIIMARHFIDNTVQHSVNLLRNIK